MSTITDQSKSSTSISLTEGERQYASFRTAAWQRFRRNKLALFGIIDVAFDYSRSHLCALYHLLYD